MTSSRSFHRVWTHARIYRPEKKESAVNDRIQGPYDRFSTVEDDARWQMLAGEYRGQLNVLVEIIGSYPYSFEMCVTDTNSRKVDV